MPKAAYRYSSDTRPSFRTVAAITCFVVSLGIGLAISLTGQSGPASCTSFSDDPLQSGTPIRAAHFRELRDCIHDLRADRGAPRAEDAWTDPTIVEGQTPVKAAHLLELRVALEAEYTERGQPPPALGGSVVQNVTLVQAEHINTVRQAMRTLSGLLSLPGASPVVFSPEPNTYAGTIQVEMTSSTDGATIRYTTDGTTPTTNSTLYSGPLTVSPTTTVILTARAYASGYKPSSTVTGTYVVDPYALAAVIFNPAPGTYDIGQSVSLTSPDQGTTIRYTVDGSVPTETSPLYSSPFALGAPTTVKARVYRSGSTTSALSSAAYSIRVATPTITPAGGEFTTMPFVTMETTTSGATIRYTTDRNEPTENSPVYSSGFTVDDYMTLKATAYKNGWAPSRTVTETYMTTAMIGADYSSPGQVTIPGISETSLSAVGAAVTFMISGATLPADAFVAVYRNGQRLPDNAVQRFSDRIQVPAALVEGRNALELTALDSDGLLVSETVTVWAGSRTVAVTVYDSAFNILPGATVAASLADAGHVTRVGITNNNGQVLLPNVPWTQTVKLWASHPSYRPLWFDLEPGSTSAYLALDLANNDFSQGLTGWPTQSSFVYRIEHSEASQPIPGCPGAYCTWREGGPAPAPDAEPEPSDESRGPSLRAASLEQTGSDFDLMVFSGHQAQPQTVTRSFVGAYGATRVSIRHRFQGSEFFRPSWISNWDWYRIVLRNTRTGGQETHQATPQLADVDANGATGWLTTSMSIDQPGDPIEITVTVAEGGPDYTFASAVYVDIVQETVHRVEHVELRDLINQNDQYEDIRPDKRLAMLSASQMAGDQVSYDGYVRIHGELTVFGPATDSIQGLWLDVIENGTVRATAELARDTVSNVRSLLLNRQFGQLQRLTIAEHDGGITPVLFEFRSSDLAALNQTNEDERLQFQIRAQFASGAPFQAHRMDQTLTKLVLYARNNRYGMRDVGDCLGLSATARDRRMRPAFPCGGDGWARPRMKQWANAVTTVTHDGASATVTWNDFSNMHAGFFPRHGEHRLGVQVDGLFDGYVAMDAAAAHKMLDFLRRYGSAVDIVFVGYSTRPVDNTPCAATVPVATSNAYWNVIRAAPALSDGRLPRNIVTNQAGHCDHFHVNVDVTRIQ
jgi:hypothetical protein